MQKEKKGPEIEPRVKMQKGLHLCHWLAVHVTSSKSEWLCSSTDFSSILPVSDCGDVSRECLKKGAPHNFQLKTLARNALNNEVNQVNRYVRIPKLFFFERRQRTSH